MHLKGHSIGFALALPSHSKTWLERVSKDKPSSLLGLNISDEGKKFYNIDTSAPSRCNAAANGSRGASGFYRTPEIRLNRQAPTTGGSRSTPRRLRLTEKFTRNRKTETQDNQILIGNNKLVFLPIHAWILSFSMFMIFNNFPIRNYGVLCHAMPCHAMPCSLYMPYNTY
jgi:hypothetical protein